jgi:hypothetical protein
MDVSFEVDELGDRPLLVLSEGRRITPHNGKFDDRFQPYEALATSLVALVIALCWGLIGAIISTLAGPSRGTLHSAAAGWAAQLLLVTVIFMLFDRGDLLQGLLHFGILLGPVGALIGAITWSIWSQDQHNGLLS